QQAGCAPLPREQRPCAASVGRRWGWGLFLHVVSCTPTPSPSPQGGGERTEFAAYAEPLLHLYELGGRRVGAVEELPLAASDLVDGNVNTTGHDILIELEAADERLEFLMVEPVEHGRARHRTCLAGGADRLSKHFTRRIGHGPERLVRVVEVRFSVSLFKSEA